VDVVELATHAAVVEPVDPLHRRVLEVIDRAQRGRQERAPRPTASVTTTPPRPASHSLPHTLEVTTADHIQFGTDWSRAPEPSVVRNIDSGLRGACRLANFATG
jgi:hypothetical protein